MLKLKPAYFAKLEWCALARRLEDINATEPDLIDEDRLALLEAAKRLRNVGLNRKAKP